jgi:hypothetical protein
MTKYIPPKRISEAFIAVAITAVAIFLLNLFLTSQSIFTRKTGFEIGQISDRTIVAPFSFPIYEDEEVLKEKQKRAAQKVRPRYVISSDAAFQTQENINRFFTEIENIDAQTLSNSEKVIQLSRKGYKLSESSYKLLIISADTETKQTCELLYSKLQSGIEEILGIGVIKGQTEKNKIIILEDGKENEVSVKNLLTKDEARQYFLEKNRDIIKTKKWETLINELLDIFLVENVVYDEESTHKAMEQAQASVPNIISEVLKNELIVQEHQKITESIYRKLHALEQAHSAQSGVKTQRGTQKILSLVSQLLYLLLVLSLFVIFFYFLHPKMLATFSLFRLSLIFTLILALLIMVVQSVGRLSPFLIPFGMPIILLAFLVDVPAAVIFGGVNFLLLTGLLNWDFSTSFIISFSGLSAILALPNPRSRGDFYHATFYIIIFFAGLTLLFGAIKAESFFNMLINIGWGIGGATISLLGSMVLLAPIEQRLPVITNIHLLELGDFSRPLLKTMAEVASGTYHHSIIVSNLAEAAAKAIDANPFLARVGSYYHDIGKTKNPEYFVENTKEKQNIHEYINSIQSAQIVKKHVEDGVKLAKDNHIPKGIIDIIQQHHGTSQISYFYQQAKNNGEKIDPKNFYYDGPKPQTKESAIVMIADIVESTTKSLENPTVEAIKNSVYKTIAKLVETDQLSECDISLKELKVIQDSMMPILLGIYQKRIEYPE